MLAALKSADQRLTRAAQPRLNPLQRAIAREAEAIREKRARIIKAEGEQEASQKLAMAARTIGEVPGALELRRLQTLSEIGVEHNSTIIAMFPVELLEAAQKLVGK